MLIQVPRGGKDEHGLERAAGPLALDRLLRSACANRPVIALSAGDPAVSDCHDHAELPAHVMREARRFFRDAARIPKQAPEPCRRRRGKLARRT